MCDEDDAGNSAREELLALLHSTTAASRDARIKALSDESLTHFYALLSDERVVTNVDALKDMEAELVARGLPAGRKH